jgi:diketogulonate reductase-like aldo/keto reductase
MPAIGLGTWELTEGTVDSVRDALRLGYRMIDTSGDYGTQRGIGEAIRADGIDRGSVFIVTKIEEDEDAYAAVRRNLAELGVDYADLVLIHRPPPRGVGMRLWQGLVRAVNDGLCREIGVSNYDVGQIEELVEKTGVVPAVNQVEWTPFGHSKELLSFCRANRIVLQAYSPLTRAERLDDESLGRIARRHRKSPAQVLIRWNLELGTVPLPKASRGKHRRENLDVFDFELDERELLELNERNDRWSALGEELAYH